MQSIINAHYNQRLFSLHDLTTKYEANTCLALPNACRRSVRALIYCYHNIHGSGHEKIAGVDYVMR
jgi:hypothetical protein